MGSTGCLCVWASQCLAYIRYHSWSVIKFTKDIYCGYVADILIISRLGAHRNNVRQTYPRLYSVGRQNLARVAAWSILSTGLGPGLASLHHWQSSLSLIVQIGGMAILPLMRS